MLGIVIFPCFVVNIVRMNRQRLCLRIFADGAGAFSGTCFGCGRLLCYRPITESMVAHFSFLSAAAFLPVLGFIFLPIAVAVLMFKASEWFRSAHSRRPCSHVLWSLLRSRWPASSLSIRRRHGLPHSAFHHRNTPAVLGIVIFPCFVVNIVRMNRQRLCLRIFADGAGTFSGTCFGCGRLLCYRPIIESMVAHSVLSPQEHSFQCWVPLFFQPPKLCSWGGGVGPSPPPVLPPIAQSPRRLSSIRYKSRPDRR